MNKDLYSGDIDWERIYRTFHDPFQTAKRIKNELGDTRMPIVFSGFPESASYLAHDMPVTFVDHSSSITDNAKRCYRHINGFQVGDITQLIATLPVTRIVIACRVSAYWDSSEYFERLATSLLSFPRELVLIDFFDRDLVEIGGRLNFESRDEFGEWSYLGLEEVNVTEPSPSELKIKVSYSLNDHSFSYEGYRSCFRKSDILRWARSKFTDCNVMLGEPLMVCDPSFTLKLIRKMS